MLEILYGIKIFQENSLIFRIYQRYAKNIFNYFFLDPVSLKCFIKLFSKDLVDPILFLHIILENLNTMCLPGIALYNNCPVSLLDVNILLNK